MFRKIFWIIAFVSLALILWYLFLKPQDYLATFKANATAGTINQTIKLWQNTLNEAEIIAQEELNELEQRITFNDSTFMYKWKIESLNDTTSRVNVLINDTQNSLANRLSMPFSDTDFEKRSKKTVLEFHEKLEEHLEKFKVTIKGVDSISDKYCAYVSLRSTQFEKAREMMKSYPLLDGFVLSSKIETDGQPFIEITHWDIKKDSIAYNFCYPIKKTDSLPDHEIVKYKRFKGGNALKAIYNGNYITSDRAWYSLINEAEKRELKVTGNPVEVFFSNPNMSTNELEWVAEIYMPLSN